MSIIKRGKYWHVVYYFNGKQRSRSAGKYKRDADKLLTKINHDINTGRYKDIKSKTFHEFVEKWLARQKPNLKTSSYEKYAGVVNKELIGKFGDIQMSKIDTEMIQDWLTGLSTRGLKPSSVNTYFATMRKLMADAVKWEYVYINPAAIVDRPKIPKTEIDFLTPEEIGRLLAAAKNKPRDHTVLMVLAMTGMRIGEALALSWDDIDLEAKTISITKTAYAGEISTPKTAGSRRKVIFPEALKMELMNYQLTCPITQANLVFPSQTGTPLDRNHVRNRMLAPALIKARLRHVTVHSLRHSYATMLIAQGENLKFIQRQLGHSSMRVTFDRYGHLLPATGFEAMERLDKTVEEKFLLAKC